MDVIEIERLISTANAGTAACQRDYVRAAAALRTLLRDRPDDGRLHTLLGVCYFHLGRTQAAVQSAQQAYRLGERTPPEKIPTVSAHIRSRVEDYVLERVGNCQYDVLGTIRDRGDGTLAVPLTIPWRSLRGAGLAGRKETCFDCGELILDRDGCVLDGKAVALFRAAFLSFTGAFAVERVRGGFRAVYPRRYGRVLIAGLIRAGSRRVQARESGNQVRRKIRVGGREVLVEDFENRFFFPLSEREFTALAGLSSSLSRQFRQCRPPSIVVAFDRPVAVVESVDPDNPDELLAVPSINRLLRKEFDRLRTAVERGRPVRLKPAYTFNYRADTPLPSHGTATARSLTGKPYQSTMPCGGSGALGLRAERAEVKAFLEAQYQALVDCIHETPVRGVFRKKPFEGRVMKVAARVYSHLFVCDQIMNALPMIYFDPEFAKQQVLTSLRWSINRQGAIPHSVYSRANPLEPHWIYIVWYLYDHCRDRQWLAAVREVLEVNNRYWDRYCFADQAGVYTGNAAFNDYDWNPPGHGTRVAGIGLNSIMYSYKTVMARIARELGGSGRAYCRQAEELKKRINELFWDDPAGFYFDYDLRHKRIFETSAPDYFLGLTRDYRAENWMPLWAGIPDAGQANRMVAKLNDPALYGRFAAVTTALSGSSCDERRLRIWTMTNWRILQGLRMYGFHREADRLSAALYNMSFRAWLREDNFPECFDATHGYRSEENSNVGGIGSMATPILLVLDRVGCYYSSFPADFGLKTRRVLTSGLGKVSFDYLNAGRKTRFVTKG